MKDITRIPLHLILMSQGYSLIHMSLREMERSKWIPLKKEDLYSKEKIMVSIKFDEAKEPYYLYYNMDGSADRGNIINFCKNRGLDPNQLLSAYLKNKELAFENIKIKTNIDNAAFIKEFNKMNHCDIYTNKLLERRGIYSSTLEYFKDSLKEDDYTNLCVPNYDVIEIDKDKSFIGLCGFTKRLNYPIYKNEDGSFREKPLKNIQKGKKGLEILKPNSKKEIKNIVITESIIDGLSIVQLKNDFNLEETMLISTSGRFGIDKISQIFNLMFEKNHLNKDIKVFLACDNDEAGKTMNQSLQDFFEKTLKRIPEILTPFTKDFNDDLRLSQTLKISWNDLNKENIYKALNEDLDKYNSTRNTEIRVFYLDKFRKVDNIFPLNQKFKNSFNNIPKHKSIRGI